MSRIKCKTLGSETTVQIVGDLNGETVLELERYWRKARTAGTTIQLDLCAVQEIDDAGKTLLTYMFGNGVELVIGARKRSTPRHLTVLGQAALS